MIKNSSFIQKKEFHVVFKGYKPEEVDKFLDTISVEFDRLIAKNQELQESLDKLRFELREQDEGEKSQDEDFKKIIQDALVSAHKVAEDIKEKAKREAQALIDKTEAEENEKLKQIRQQKERAESELSVLTGEYEEIRSRVKELSLQFNNMVESMLGLDVEKYKGQAEQPKEEAGEAKAIDKEPSSQKAEQEVDPEALMSEDMIKQEDDKAADNERIEQEVTGRKGPEKEEKINQNEPEKDQEGPRKEKSKKIDIADPDLIESFFKSEEDKNY